MKARSGDIVKNVQKIGIPLYLKLWKLKLWKNRATEVIQNLEENYADEYGRFLFGWVCFHGPKLLIISPRNRRIFLEILRNLNRNQENGVEMTKLS